MNWFRPVQLLFGWKIPSVVFKQFPLCLFLYFFFHPSCEKTKHNLIDTLYQLNGRQFLFLYEWLQVKIWSPPFFCRLFHLVPGLPTRKKAMAQKGQQPPHPTSADPFHCVRGKTCRDPVGFTPGNGPRVPGTLAGSHKR